MAWEITGKIGPIPYSFGLPTRSYLRERLWNREGPLFTPHICGIGWSINFYRLLKLLRIVR